MRKGQRERGNDRRGRRLENRVRRENRSGEVLNQRGSQRFEQRNMRRGKERLCFVVEVDQKQVHYLQEKQEYPSRVAFRNHNGGIPRHFVQSDSLLQRLIDAVKHRQQRVKLRRVQQDQLHGERRNGFHTPNTSRIARRCQLRNPVVQEGENHSGGDKMRAEEKEKQTRGGSEERWMGGEGKVHKQIGEQLVDVIGRVSD